MGEGWDDGRMRYRGVRERRVNAYTVKPTKADIIGTMAACSESYESSRQVSALSSELCTVQVLVGPGNLSTLQNIGDLYRFI